MKSTLLRGVLTAVASIVLLSCADAATGPNSSTGRNAGAATRDVTPGSAKVVISQVYGGGGNASATFQNDFVELFNAGTASQDLSGWSVQYTSATGTGNFGANATLIVALSGSIDPGQYYLVRLFSQAAVGAVLPAADATGTINMAAGAGKVALTNTALGLGCNGSTVVCDDTQLSHIIDLVGYGTGGSGANYFEGAGPAPTISSTLADFRKDSGCQDTNSNSADFSSALPAPRNKLTTPKPCVVAVGPLANVIVAGGTVSAGSTITLTAGLRDANGLTITDPAATFTWTSSDETIAKVLSSTGNQATIEGEGTGGATTIVVTATSNGVTKSATPAPAITVVGPLDHVIVAGPTTVGTGSTITLVATLKDAIDQTIVDPAATYTWTSSDPATAQVLSTSANTATIKGLIAGGPIMISFAATSNGVSKSPSPQAEVTVTGPATIVPSTTFVSEIHYDNAGTDAGEAIEIEGDANSSLNGWKLVLYDGNGGKMYGGGTPAAPMPLVGVFPATCGARGVLVFPFLVNGIQNGSPDGWALVNPQNQVTEFRSYEGTFTAVDGPAAGLTSTAIEADETVAPGANRSVQRAGTGVWFGPYNSTFGECNSPVPLGAQGSITLTSGKTLLARGMQTQFFFSGTDASGQPATSVVYSTSNSSIITVDQKGIVTGKSLGLAQLIATAPDGATGTVDITVFLADGSTGIRLGHNEEFGEPHDANPADDFIIHRPQYTVSYNPNRGGANWVSWNLDVTHIGDSGRCTGTCYSADTVLSNAGLTAYTTADWVSNVGGVTGYDRGHMAPSADWTSSEADNNTTFFLTNFLPQRADLNQGPWEVLEIALRDSVKTGRDAYIIAGGIFTNGVGLGTLLNLGKIAIPDSTWKIAVITPAGTGIGAGGTLPPNTTVMVVNMPNVQGIRDNDWHMYLTTVAKIEQSTGYNFLDLLSEPTQCLAEVRNCAPTARVTSATGFTGNEGSSITFSGATSSDPNGDALTMSWFVNGAPAGSGATLTRAFANDGTYEVKLVATDPQGSSSTSVATVAISNVAPVLGALSAPSGAAEIGTSVSVSASFSDVGILDTHIGVVDWGDGATSAASIVEASGNGTVSASHSYSAPGNYTVTVTVADDNGSSSVTQSAVVSIRATTPTNVWLGLKTSDDVGTYFDLKVEFLKNGAVVATGQLDAVPGGSSGFNNASLRQMLATLSQAPVYGAGDVLGVRISARIAEGVTGHRSGTARLWYNDGAANSRTQFFVNGQVRTYYLANGFGLSTNPGVGPRASADVTVDRLVNGNAFKPLGTWSLTF